MKSINAVSCNILTLNKNVRTNLCSKIIVLENKYNFYQGKRKRQFIKELNYALCTEYTYINIIIYRKTF